MLDPISEMRELAEKVRQIAQEQETSVEHVLVVLTTVLLAPQNENTDSHTSLRTGSE